MKTATRIVHIWLAATILLLSAGLAAAQEEQQQQQPPQIEERIFTIKHGDVQSIYRMARSFVTPWGRINYDDRSAIIVVRDTREAIDHIADIIAQMDIPPENIGLTFFAFKATREGAQQIPGNLPEGVRKGLSELGKVMAYKDFQPIDSGMLTLSSGARKGELRLSGKDKEDIEITFDLQFNRQSRHLKLFELIVGLHNREQGKWLQLMQTDIGIDDGGVAVVGASKLDGDNEALVVIVTMNIIQD
jgi:hypothetical protein